MALSFDRWLEKLSDVQYAPFQRCFSEFYWIFALSSEVVSGTLYSVKLLTAFILCGVIHNFTMNGALYMKQQSGWVFAKDVPLTVYIK